MKPTSLLTALALVLTLGAWGPAQAGAQIPGAGGLAQRVERLGAELTAAQSLLKRTRTTLRRQATRLSRLERRLGGDDGPGALGIATPDAPRRRAEPANRCAPAAATRLRGAVKHWGMLAAIDLHER